MLATDSEEQNNFSWLFSAALKIAMANLLKGFLSAIKSMMILVSKNTFFNDDFLDGRLEGKDDIIKQF